MQSIAERKQRRRFPSVFQAWSPVDTLPNEDAVITLARHDLAWVGLDRMGLRWDSAHDGEGTALVADGLGTARAMRERLCALNPNLILLTEIRYRDAPRNFLATDHRWWLRNAAGEIEAGWEEGGFNKLDFHNPDYVQHVARRAQAVVASGAFDGVMLDWWHDDEAHLALVQTVREAIGPDAIIIVNANDRTTPLTAPYINGTFMECTVSDRPDKWTTIAETLMWAERHYRSPQLNCLETWYHTSRQDLHLMRATTTLALTHSDGYCLFSDPNPLPTADHRHDWYDFWNRRLGAPLSPSRAESDAAVLPPEGVKVCPQWAHQTPLAPENTRCVCREFEGGTVVYNPMESEAVVVHFPTARMSVATGMIKTDHYLGNCDGDIYVHLTG